MLRRRATDIFAPRDLFGHAIAFSPCHRRNASGYAPSSLFGRTIALRLVAPLSQKVSAMPPLFGNPTRFLGALNPPRQVRCTCRPPLEKGGCSDDLQIVRITSYCECFALIDLFGHAVAFSPCHRRNASGYAPSSLFGRTIALRLVAPLSQKVSAMPPLFGSPNYTGAKGGYGGAPP